MWDSISLFNVCKSGKFGASKAMASCTTRETCGYIQEYKFQDYGYQPFLCTQGTNNLDLNPICYNRTINGDPDQVWFGFNG